MKRRCSPRFVQNVHAEARSWRKAAKKLNACFGVNLSHLAWQNYSTGRRDIADAAARAALGLGPRPCPACGRKSDPMQLSRLLKRMTAKDLRKWNQLRAAKKYNAASQFLGEVYRRTIHMKGGETR